MTLVHVNVTLPQDVVEDQEQCKVLTFGMIKAWVVSVMAVKVEILN